MARRAALSKEVKRTIRLKFLTETGKIHTISLNCASPELAGAEGAARVKRVMEGILEYDVFTVKLVKAVSAELVERRILLTREDFQARDRSNHRAAPKPEPYSRTGMTLSAPTPPNQVNAEGCEEIAAIVFGVTSLPDS